MAATPPTTLKVRHVFERDADKFEADVNEALRRIITDGGVVGDIKYVSDPTSRENPRGGFGALIIYEQSR